MPTPISTARPSMVHGPKWFDRISPYAPNVSVKSTTVLATISGLALSESPRSVKYAATRRLTSSPKLAGSLRGNLTPA